MKPTTGVAAAAIVATLLGAAGPVRAGGPVRAQNVAGITIDGNLADWKDVAIQPLENGLTIAAIAQDDRFLYVNFTFTDLALARRVLRTGAIVWVNAAGKHEPDLGLRYRGTDDLQKTYEMMQEAAGETAAAQPATAARSGWGGGGSSRQRQPLGVLEVLHHAVADTVIANGKTPDDASAACNVVDGTFVYEFRILLSELSAPAPAAPAGPERTIAVGIQMSGRTPADRAARGGGGRMRARRQQQTDGAPPWANAPQRSPAQSAAPGATEQSAGASAPTVTTGATDAAGTTASPTTTDNQPQATSATDRARAAQPTWLDVTVLLPKTEPAPKQE
jgi:hypothetical protein